MTTIDPQRSGHREFESRPSHSPVLAGSSSADAASGTLRVPFVYCRGEPAASAAYGRVGFGEFKVEQAAAGDAEASRPRQANATPAPEPNGTAPVPETLTPTAPRGTNHSAGKCLHETNTACAPVTPDAEAAANTTDSAAIQAQSQTITHTKEPNSSTCDSTPTTRSSDEAYANNATMQKPAKQDQQASTPDNKQEHCASPDKKQAPTTVVRAAGSGHTIRASRKAVGIRRRSSS